MGLDSPHLAQPGFAPFDSRLGAFLLQDFVEIARLLRLGALDHHVQFQRVPQGVPLTYETFLATVHPDDRDYVHERWLAALRGEPYEIEHRVVVGEDVRWVREKAYLEFDDAGELQGGFGITQDITRLKQAEQALLASKEFTDKVLNASLNGLYIYDLEKRLNTFINPSYIALTGYTLEEINAMPDPFSRALLENTDVLVDGRFLQEQPETERRWIGSSNQRVHFLTDRYRADDLRWKSANTLEIRWSDGELRVNGFPAANAVGLWKRSDPRSASEDSP